MIKNHDPHWIWNGDHNLIVLDASVLLIAQGDGNGGEKIICHSFVGIEKAKPGQIQFLHDSSHWLAGQIVDLPEFENKTSKIRKLAEKIQTGS